MDDFKGKTLSNINQISLKRHEKTHPDEIRSSIKRSIQQMNNENNLFNINQPKKK